MGADNHPKFVANTTAERYVRTVDPAGLLERSEAKNRSTTTRSVGLSSNVRAKSRMDVRRDL